MYTVQVLNTMPPYSEEKENMLLSLSVGEDEKDKEKSKWNVNATGNQGESSYRLYPLIAK